MPLHSSLGDRAKLHLKKKKNNKKNSLIYSVGVCVYIYMYMCVYIKVVNSGGGEQIWAGVMYMYKRILTICILISNGKDVLFPKILLISKKKYRKLVCQMLMANFGWWDYGQSFAVLLSCSFLSAGGTQ